jgi:5-methylcytosine-specific restriction protein A
MAIAPRTVSAPRAPWTHVVPVVRIRGRALQRLRDALFAREPNCRHCAARGLFTVATIRDHIVNLEEGGTEDESNVQPLCQVCSDLKTAGESQRGKRRAGG